MFQQQFHQVNEKLFFCRASPSNRVTSQCNQVIIRGTDGAEAEPWFSDPFEVLSPPPVSLHHEKRGLRINTKANTHAPELRQMCLSFVFLLFVCFFVISLLLFFIFSNKVQMFNIISCF